MATMNLWQKPNKQKENPKRKNLKKLWGCI